MFAACAFAVAVGGALAARLSVPRSPPPATWAAAVLLGALGARVATRPLEPLFRVAHARSREALLGEAAEITTGRVDARFGQARLTVDGDELLVQVRCDQPDTGLRRGAEALVVAFDPRREAFVVEALPTTHPHGG
ncbi:MAG: hypothetical protein R3F59_21975 [Myxococcota bacterium]